MTNKKYEALVKKHNPKENKVKYALTAFLVGGLMGLLGETLIRVYIMFFDVSRNDASTYMIISRTFNTNNRFRSLYDKCRSRL